MRQVAYLRLTSEFFRSLFTAGLKRPYEIIQNALPDDAEIVGADYDAFNGTLRVAFRSEKFAPVEEGAVVTEMDRPVIQTFHEREPLAGVVR